MAIRFNVPPLTRLLIVLTLTLSASYVIVGSRLALPDADRGQQSLAALYLTLNPSVCVYYPWTVLTSTFTEPNIMSFLLSTVNVFFAGRYLERAWGSKELGKVVFITALLSNLLMIPIYILLSFVRDAALSRSISGGVPLQAGFLVALKQLVPEHTVTILKGFIKIRIKHFPALFLLVTLCIDVLLRYHGVALQAWTGFLMTWTYLRFYKRQPEISSSTTGNSWMRGDASETFAFPSFFPDKIQPSIALVSNQIYNVLVALRLCTPFSIEEIESGNQQAATRGQAGLPGLLNGGAGRRGHETGKREEAERRRALALQALDQRLRQANVNTNTQSSSDSRIGNEQSTAVPAAASATLTSDTREAKKAEP